MPHYTDEENEVWHDLIAIYQAITSKERHPITANGLHPITSKGRQPKVCEAKLWDPVGTK